MDVKIVDGNRFNLCYLHDGSFEEEQEKEKIILMPAMTYGRSPSQGPGHETGFQAYYIGAFAKIICVK